MTEHYNKDNLDRIQLEEQNNPNAMKYGLLLILYSAFVSFFLNLNFIDLINPLNLFDLGILSFGVLLYISTWVVRIIVAIWLVNKAKLLNRSPLGWGLFGFFIPSISLIIFSFLDYKISDIKIKELVKNIRLDYLAELQNEKHIKLLNNEELELVEKRLKLKYQKKLDETIIGLKTKEEAESIRKLQAEGIIDSNIDIKEQEEIIRKNILTKNSVTDWSEEWMNEADKCPACGTKNNKRAVICQECGLTIK